MVGHHGAYIGGGREAAIPSGLASALGSHTCVALPPSKHFDCKTGAVFNKQKSILVETAATHWNVSSIGAPDLVGLLDRDAAQQYG